MGFFISFSCVLTAVWCFSSLFCSGNAIFCSSISLLILLDFHIKFQAGVLVSFFFFFWYSSKSYFKSRPILHLSPCFEARDKMFLSYCLHVSKKWQQIDMYQKSAFTLYPIPIFLLSGKLQLVQVTLPGVLPDHLSIMSIKSLWRSNLQSHNENSFWKLLRCVYCVFILYLDKQGRYFPLDALLISISMLSRVWPHGWH